MNKLGLIALALVISLPVFAQDGAPSQEDARRAPPRLDEIVVTAQKRAESVQDVPIAVSVMTADRLKASNMENFEDVALATPNTEINMTPGYVQVGMRGLNAPINDGMEQSVGFYVDGIYYGKTAFLQDAFLDLERVEMLKGPQGTLFGKNTIAGAINIHTARPVHEFAAGGQIGISEMGGKKGELMLNVPIIEDAIAGRLSATWHKRDGYVENIMRGTDEKRVDKWGVRGKFLYELSDALDIAVTLYAGRAQDNGQGWEPFVLAQNAQLIHGAFNPDLEAKADFVGHADAENRSESDTRSINMEANWDIGRYTVTLIAGAGTLDERFLLDGDTASAPIVIWDNDDEYWQSMAELRVVTEPFDVGLGEVDVIAGLFGFVSDYHGQSELRMLPDDTVGNLLDGLLQGGPLGDLLGGLLAPLTGGVVDPLVRSLVSDALYQSFEQRTQTYAIFGQATWRPLADLAVILGLRGSIESKSVVLDQRYEDTGLIIQAAFGVERYTLDTTRDEHNVAPKVSVKYDIDDDMMIYATYGEGFKAGGFNPIARNPGEATFEQETSRAYEIGTKITALDGLATINLAAFHTKFSDMQIQSFIGNGFIVRNAAEATTQGVELEANYTPFEGTVIYVGGGYTDATFDSFEDGPCIASATLLPSFGSAPSCDLSGERLPRAPKWNLSMGFNAGIPVWAGKMAIVFGADASWRSKIFFELDQDPIDTQDAYWLFNARVGLADPDGLWRVIVHGKNLTDEKIKTFSADMPILNGSHMGFLMPPRIISAEVAVSF